MPARAKLARLAEEERIVSRKPKETASPVWPARVPSEEPDDPARSFGNFDRVEHFANHLVGSDPLEVGFRLQDYAMAQNRTGSRFHVVGDQEVAAFGGCNSSCDQHHIHGRPGARAQTHGRIIARSRYQCDDVSEQRSLHANLRNLITHSLQSLRPYSSQAHAFELARVKTFLKILEDLDFLLRFGIADSHLHKEAIQLRFRQRIGPFKFNGVLSGKHGKKL